MRVCVCFGRVFGGRFFPPLLGGGGEARVGSEGMCNRDFMYPVYIVFIQCLSSNNCGSVIFEIVFGVVCLND